MGINVLCSLCVRLRTCCCNSYRPRGQKKGEKKTIRKIAEQNEIITIYRHAESEAKSKRLSVRMAHRKWLRAATVVAIRSIFGGNNGRVFVQDYRLSAP